MQYVQVGQLAPISKICLGTMTFGSPVEAKDAIELVLYAKDKCGINFIDTANMYEGYARYAGSPGGVAEEIIGNAIRGRRSDFVVATKVGMKVGSQPEDENTSPEAIRIQLRKSLARLQTNYVDIYYLHRFDPDTDPHLIARAMGEELKAGTILSWGVSNYSADQLQALLDAARDENVPAPLFCEPPLSRLNPGALDSLLPLCEKNGISAVPYQVLQGGLLTGKYHRNEQAPEGSRMAEKPEWMKKLDDDGWRTIEMCEQEAQAQGLSMTQAQLKWALSQPACVSTLIGVKRKSQIDEAAAWL